MSRQENIFHSAFYENMQWCEMEIFILFVKIKQPETSELENTGLDSKSTKKYEKV